MTKTEENYKEAYEFYKNSYHLVMKDWKTTLDIWRKWSLINLIFNLLWFLLGIYWGYFIFK